MSEHKIASRDEWDAARAELLVREKELTRLSDQLARQRQDLPWLRVEKPYTFQTADGPKRLAELFDGRSQLVVYHFMFGPEFEAGCPVCSTIADSFDGVVAHLAARDVTMIAISRAPVRKLLAFRERMGWSFNWASSHETDFNPDFERLATREQAGEWADQVPEGVSRFASVSGADLVDYLMERPGLSVFTKSGEDVYLSYATTSRGLELVMTYYGILDRVPRGRDRREPPDPFWIRHHDRYERVADQAAAQ